MRRAGLLIVVLLFSGVAFAGEVKVNIPEAGWSITFDSPPLSEMKESRREGEYAFKANSGRFNISFFVEKPHGTGSGNRDCYNFYWPQASRNPMIAKDSIVTSETSRYVRVQYDMFVDFQGKRIQHRNINYYFVYRDKWIDVHISIIDPRQEDEAIFGSFDKSLDYGS